MTDNSTLTKYNLLFYKILENFIRKSLAKKYILLKIKQEHCISINLILSIYFICYRRDYRLME